MSRISKDYKLRVIQRARQIISDHPDWGRRKVNRQLRSELGTGLRDTTINKMSVPTRRAVSKGMPTLPPGDSITFQEQRQILRQAGFLPSEIGKQVAGISAGRKNLGHILASVGHDQFRPVLERMIQERWLERRAFLKHARREGWSKSRIDAKWTARIIKHYRRGEFFILSDPRKPRLHPTSDGGGFLTAEGKISPWGLYHAFLAYLRAIDPFGGLGFDSPRAAGGKPKAMRVRTKRAIREELNTMKTQLEQTRASIRGAGQTKDWGKVRQFAKTESSLMGRVSKLEDELRGAIR